MWLIFAFSGPVLWALSTHLDKYLVERYFRQTSMAVLVIITALFGVIPLPFIWIWVPHVVAVPPSSMLIIAFAGVLYLAAIWLYLVALRTEEASVVAPYFQAAPLFGYVLAYLVLGETLTPMQMLGGLLIIAATLVLSVRGGPPGSRFKARLAGLMLACALFSALMSLIFKVFAIKDDFWPTAFWLLAGQAVLGLVLLAVPRYREELRDALRKNPLGLATIGGLNELINLAGSLSARYALVLAPVSLVQAITSTTALFVLAFGVILSVFFPTLVNENLSGTSLARKALSAILAVAGVILISR